MQNGHVPLALLLATCISVAPAMAGGGVSFGQSTLDFDGLGGVTSSTSIEFGPDGRLYVLQLDGTIKVLTVTRDGANDYRVTALETLTAVRDIPNFDDDGTPNPGETDRLCTGMTVGGTAEQPIIYATSSDPRVGGDSSGIDLDLDTNSCVITRLTWSGTEWAVVDLVRGLPRNEENHATNGLHLVEIGGSPFLLAAQGGMTNAGGPSNNFAYTSEYVMAAAVLSVDLAMLDSLDVQNDGTRDYIYDLPTLDDPTRPNANGIDDPDDPGYDGIDAGDPWGGNDGLNQARVVPDGPVRIFAPGFRNTYELVVTESGGVYVTDNGANANWGGFPENEGPGGTVTNTYRVGEPGSTGDDGDEPQVNNLDHLSCVTTDIETYVFGSFYGGHPCPTRANPFGSGLYTRGVHTAASGGLFFSDDWFRTVPYDPDGAGDAADASRALPADWPPLPDSLSNAVEGDFRNPGGTNPDGPADAIVTTWVRNTNGIDEYTADFFGGALQGTLIAGRNGGRLHRVALNPDGTLDTLEENFITGLGGNPLGIECLGPADTGVPPAYHGTIWIGTFNTSIVILEPPGIVDTPPGPSAAPSVTRLLPAVPNPFRSTTTIAYEIAAPGNVRVRIFDMGGRHLRTLFDGARDAGRHAVGWDGRDGSGVPLGAGVYLVALDAPGVGEMRRTIRMR